LFCFLSVATSGYGATFSVAVVNGSQKVILADYPVSVRVEKVNNGRLQETLQKKNGRTNSDGFFAGEIEAAAGKVLVAEINYRGIKYFSKPVIIDDKYQHYDLLVNGYEITSSHAEVSIPSRTMVVNPIDERTLEIYDSLQVINNGNNTYVGKFNDALDLTQVLHIPVPKDYTVRGYQAGGESPKMRTVGGAIVSQNEIKPGNSQISIRYLVVSDIGFFDLSLFSQKDTPEIQEINLYFPVASKWNVKPATLNPADKEMLGGKNYLVWKGQPGSALRLKAYGPGYAGGFNLWHGTIILAFLVTGVCLFLARKKIELWHLIQEEKKLKKLQAKLTEETDDHELADYYQPLRQVLINRLQEAQQIMKGG